MKLITGKCTIITSNNGSNYLGIDIPEHEYKIYESFMLHNNFHTEVELKLKRDRGHYHITLINSAQWGSLGKKGLHDEILKELEGKEFTFEVGGIGTAEKDNNKTFFVITENDELTTFRDKYELGLQEFHMTLAFKEKDVFGVPKNKNSCIFTNTAIQEFHQSILRSQIRLKA